MKKFSTFIKEEVEAFRVTDVEATYLVQPNKIVLEAPETFQESDIQQYIDDRWLNSLPSSPEKSEKYFGKNNINIIDAHFEYDTFEHIDIEPKDYIEWDEKYSDNNINDDIKLDYFTITNLKYIITFDQFDLVDVDENNIDENIKKIFKACDSTYTNKYPIEIKFVEDSLKYNK